MPVYDFSEGDFPPYVQTKPKLVFSKASLGTSNKTSTTISFRAEVAMMKKKEMETWSVPRPVFFVF